MELNLDAVAAELFGKLRTRFPDVSLGDENSAITNKPKQARFFDFGYKANGVELGRVTIQIKNDSEDDTEKQGFYVIFSPRMLTGQNKVVLDNWYTFLRSLRQFARRNGFDNFDTREIDKDNLEKRDYSYLAKNTGEIKMAESKLYGTNRTSWQDIGNAKIVIKHSQPINIDLPQGRSLNIESIYIENVEGERFKFAGSLGAARAMARHVSEGGNTFDEIGKHIYRLSEELGKLRHFKNYVQRHAPISEAFNDLTTRVLDRIENIKNELHNIKTQSGYTDFKTNYQPPQAKEIPSELVNDWVDKLTLRTFNEELKDVFPFLYNLVEGPIETLDFSDIANEQQDVDNADLVKTEAPEFDEYTKNLENINPEFARNPFEETVRKLISKGATPVTEFVHNGETLILADVMHEAGLRFEDFFTLSEEQKKGLYYYVNKRKKAGTSRSKNHPKAPSEQDWKNAAKTAKSEELDEGLGDTKTDILDTYKGYKFAVETQTEDDRYVKFYSAIGPDGKEHSLPKGTTVEQFKKFVDSKQGVAEGSGKNVVKSVKVGNFRHDLVDTGMGWQVRIYNGDELYDTGMSKNSEQKGLAALEDAVAYTEKQTRTKRQGVSEYGTHPSQRVDPRTGKKYVPPKSPLGKGVAEGSQPPVCKHCGKRQGEHQRGKCPKGTKTAVGYTDYGPTKFEPKEPKQQGVAEGKERCPQCGMTNCTCAPGKCKCKPIAGWIPNKGFKKDIDEEDNVTAKKKDKPLPDTGNPMEDVKQFVESFFDYTTRKFPKGPTGVMIAVNEKFGDQAVQLAKEHMMNLIQGKEKVEIQAENSELANVLKLAGLAKINQ